jgi:hypothetical protein
MLHSRIANVTRTSPGSRRRTTVPFFKASTIALGIIAPLALTTQTASATAGPVTETATNAVVSVTFGLGWNVSTNSTSTSLVLVGPGGMSALFFTTPVSASETLPEALQTDLADRQKVAPGARVCSQPKAQKLPGSPVVVGTGEVMCFPLKSGTGTTVLYGDLLNVAFVNADGTKLKLEIDANFSESTSTAILEDDLVPVIFSAKWEQIKA